jgi:hypothetical protein
MSEDQAERAAILEYEAGLPRWEAERLATSTTPDALTRVREILESLRGESDGQR